jgi:hypothetical protein
MELKKIILPIIYLTALCNVSTCIVDIKQIPSPSDLNNSSLTILNKPIYLGKFEVFTANRLEYTKAWKYTFKANLKNNRVFSDVKEFFNNETPDADTYILDVEIIPDYKDRYNYWVTWPAIYPVPLYWPIQMRTANYSVVINYSIFQSNKIIFQSSIVESDSYTINLYGFFRTSDFEKMIETTNVKAIDKCSKEILKHFL